MPLKRGTSVASQDEQEGNSFCGTVGKGQGFRAESSGAVEVSCAFTVKGFVLRETPCSVREEGYFLETVGCVSFSGSSSKDQACSRWWKSVWVRTFMKYEFAKQWINSFCDE